MLEERGRLAGLDHVLWRLVLDTLREAATPAAPVTLLHGDLNPTNILRAERGWLAIDPKPLIGDATMEVARLVLQLHIPEGSDPSAIVGGRIARAADVLGRRADDIARWTFVDAVSMASFTRSKGDLASTQGILGSAHWVVPSLA
jgi:streptomycin 6-kinase